MTGRQIYNGVLATIGKTNASAIHLDEFNFILNDVITTFVNSRYPEYAKDQQATDDLKFLQKTAKFNVKLLKEDGVTYRTDSTYNQVGASVYSLAESGDNTIEVSSVADIKAGSKIRFDSENAGTTYVVASVGSAVYPYTINLTIALTQDYPEGTPIFIETPYVDMEQKDTYADYKVDLTLPSADYLHLVGCRTVWLGKKPGHKSGQFTRIVYPAKRMTEDIRNVTQNNVYARPDASRPYFNVKDNIRNGGVSKLDMSSYRAYQNRPTIEVITGRKRNDIQLDFVELSYIKIPERVIVDDIDIFTEGNDESQVLELPDHLASYIIGRVSTRILEITESARIATQPQISAGLPQGGAQQATQRQAQPTK